MEQKKKLIRVTTADISLDKLIPGQLKYLNQYYDVIGVSADTGVLNSVAEREGIRTIAVPMHREISLKSDIKCLFLLRKIFKQEKPFIVHANTPKGSLLSMMASRMAGVPHRIYMVTGLRYQGATGIMRFILKTMERISCLCATKVIPEGNGVLHCLKDDHITKKSLQVVHNGNINGIDTDYFSRSNPDLAHHRNLREELGFTADDFVFVFVGRIVRDKGMHELAYSMRRLPKAKLLLVGSFEDGDPVEAADVEFFKTSPNVKCVGWQDDVRPYLLISNALVFPSYREGFPNAPMQAGSMNLPSIVTNINGCNEIIKDGLNGKIIQPHSEQALKEAMRWFMEHTADVKRMAENARVMIQERYEQSDVWKALLSVYQNLN